MSRTYQYRGDNRSNPITLGAENYGGYFSITIGWQVVVTIVVPDILGEQGDYGTVHVAISNREYHINIDHETGDGGGFWNIGGLAWPVISGSNSYSHRLSGVSYDSWSTAFNDMQQLASQNNTNILWIAGASDAVSDPTSNHNSWDGSGNYSRSLTASDWNADGSLKKIEIMDIVARYWEQDTVGLAGNAISHLVTPITIDSIGVDWDYVPWARKVANSGWRWRSCNNTQGNFAIAENGSWRTIRNNQLDASKDHAWARHDDIWVKSPIIGGGF